MRSFSVAVVGATGNVGKEMLNTLAVRQFPISDIYALASNVSVGKSVSFGDSRILKVQDLEKFDFSCVDFALFSAGSEVSDIFAPKAAETGCIVIDNTPRFRMDPDVPLIIPEVNLECLEDYAKKNIIANPNCAVIQLLIAVNPIHQLYGVRKLVVSTYQSVSGAGKSAMDELYNQTKAKFTPAPVPGAEQKIFERQIAFNCIPKIGDFDEYGSTSEESKVVYEVRKIIQHDVEVSVTCVRVPVFVGHSEAVHIECHEPVDFDEVERILYDAEGVQLLDWDAIFTPTETVGEDAVFISRVRKDLFDEKCLSMWVVSDNLRKGAALNAVQIAEALIKDFV